jgi:hypothetical protein
MTRDELIEAFEAGDMGDVEFVELALDAGMDLDAINDVLARVLSDADSR